MSGFSTFLNPIKEENIKYIASKRFVEDGKPVEWELNPICSKTDRDIRKTCIKKDQFDTDAYLLKLAAASITYPNLNEAALQDGYGVMGAENLLEKMLYPGELNQLELKVQEINGFLKRPDELVEEAKN